MRLQNKGKTCGVQSHTALVVYKSALCVHIYTHAVFSTRKLLFPAVPNTTSRGWCCLLAATDRSLRKEVDHKQSPLWQFPDVSQQSTWPADDSPGRCGHFLDSSMLFLHRLCSERQRESGWASSAKIMQDWEGHSSNYHTVHQQKPDLNMSLCSFRNSWYLTIPYVL